MVMARMRSGFAVIGDTQHLPGYSLLLCEHAAMAARPRPPTLHRWDSAERIEWPVSHYPPDERNDPKHRYDDAVHGDLRSRIARELKRLMRDAYRGPNAPPTHVATSR